MKINRGIIESGANQTKYIISVGHIFKFEQENFNHFDFKDNQKILGASTDRNVSGVSSISIFSLLLGLSK